METLPSFYKHLPKTLTTEEFKYYSDLFYNHHDESAQMKIIEGNLRLVAKLASKFIANNPSYEFDDLFSIGYQGLKKAVDTFDPDKSFAFSSYASRCIQNEILQDLRKKKILETALPFDDSVIKNPKGEEFSLSEVLFDPDDFVEEVLDNLEKEDRLKKIKFIMKTKLSDKYRKILESYYGIGTKKKKTAEIAKEFNLSPSSVRQYISKSIRIIKNELNKQEHELNAEIIGEKNMNEPKQLNTRAMIKQRNQEILRLYFDKENPKTASQIAQMFDIAKSRVIQLACQARKNDPTLQRDRLPTERRKEINQRNEQILKLYFDPQKTMTKREIAELFGVSVPLINYIIRCEKLKNPDFQSKISHLKKERDAEILSLYYNKENPMSADEIAEKLNLSYNTIRRVVYIAKKIDPSLKHFYSQSTKDKLKQRLSERHQGLDQRNAEISKLYFEQNLRIREIAEMYNLTNHAILQIVAKSRAQNPNLVHKKNKSTQSPILKQRNEKILSLYIDQQNPKTVKQIAMEMDLSFTTIWGVLTNFKKENSELFEKRPNPTELRNAEILRLYYNEENPMKPKELAEKFGLKYSNISQIISRDRRKKEKEL